MTAHQQVSATHRQHAVQLICLLQSLEGIPQGTQHTLRCVV